MFKKTLVAAALATATMGASAAVQLAGDAFQIYGQAAGNLTLATDNVADSNTTLATDLESRIGFRGVVEFENFAPNFVWQIEGGNANNGEKSGALGARDTYLGLDFEGIGSFKYGRQLVAAYNLVDWPHSNPGLGNVFDWHNKIGATYQDRADHVIRYDSASFGGVNISATLSNMEKDIDQVVYSATVSYSPVPMLNLHAGYYGQGDHEVGAPEKTIQDDNTGLDIINPAYTAWVLAGGPAVKEDANTYAIVGGGLYIDAFTFTAAYKDMQKGDNSQGAVSTTAQYVFDGQYVVKAGYATTFESDNATSDDSRTAITGRLGYLLPSAYLYFDVRNYSQADADTEITNFLLGAEYYF
jgi:predicted porin